MLHGVVDVREPRGDELCVGIVRSFPPVPAHEGVQLLEARRRELRKKRLGVREVVGRSSVGDARPARALAQGEALDTALRQELLGDLQKRLSKRAVMVGLILLLRLAPPR
jgi:hypothetical protein